MCISPLQSNIFQEPSTFPLWIIFAVVTLFWWILDVLDSFIEQKEFTLRRWKITSSFPTSQSTEEVIEETFVIF